MSKDNLYRILTPSEFIAMKDAPLSDRFHISSQKRNMWLDTLMFTGMRYEELLGLDAHWEWFDSKNNAITIPVEFLKQKKILEGKISVYEQLLLVADAIDKPKLEKKLKTAKNTLSQLRERVVHLTPEFSKRLFQYLREFGSLELPTRDGMNANLKRWFWEVPEFEGMNWYPTVKTFRKTWESWLLFADYPLIKVARSQGHTVAVCEHYYANLPPTLKSEVEQVKKMTEGWHT